MDSVCGKVTDVSCYQREIVNGLNVECFRICHGLDMDSLLI